MLRHLLALSLASCLSFAQAKEARLLAPGQPVPSIVLAADAEDQEKYAAEDLRIYLGKMSGREWQIVNQPPAEGRSILIGNVPGNEALQKEIETLKLGREGFILDITEDGIQVAGGSKFGTAYGVYELLEKFGVRWFFPGEWGEVVPRNEELKIATGKTVDRPVFTVRQMHTAGAKEEEGDWFRRNRHNRSGFYGHSRLINPKKHAATHPEWYAEIDGVRQVDDPNYKLCHSNPAMVEQAAEEVLELIRKRKADTKVAIHDGYRHLAADYNLISISPRDGGAFCRCAECVKMGSLSDRLQIFANRIAAQVRKEFPDYRVGYYGAYAEHQAPPTVKADTGVVVVPTTWTRNFFKPLTDISNRVYLEKIESFKGLSPEMAVRDFDGLSVWWGAGPMTLADVHAADYPLYHELGIRGIITEAGSGWGPWGYSYYLMGRLWWNPKADLAALKKDFVEKAYGEAAQPMRTYYELLDKAAVHPSPTDLYTMRQKLEQAAALAVDPGVKMRVNYLRAHFLLNDIYQRHLAGEASEDDVELYHQLNASIPASVSPYSRVKRILRNFPKSKSPRPALSEDELQKLLAATPLPEPGRTYTAWVDQDDLRLQPMDRDENAQWSEALGVSLRYGPATLLFYAQAGEKLHLQQTSTRWKEYATAYDLQNPELVSIAEGVANGETIIDIVAPSTGVYTLTLSCGSRYPNLSSTSRHVVLKASTRHQSIHPMGRMNAAYFYVPKGTREFAIVAKAYEPLTIQIGGPIDHPTPFQPIRQTSQIFTEHPITVPEGADGKVWRMSLSGGKKDLFLQGIPPFLASHPARLITLISDNPE